MKIESISQLKKILSLCQDHGVTSIDIDGIKMSLKPIQKASNSALELQPEAYIPVPKYTPVQAQETQDEAITSNTEATDTPNALTDDQLLFYSSRAEPN